MGAAFGAPVLCYILIPYADVTARILVKRDERVPSAVATRAVVSSGPRCPYVWPLQDARAMLSHRVAVV